MGETKTVLSFRSMLKHEGLCTAYGLTKWLVENACRSIDQMDWIDLIVSFWLVKMMVIGRLTKWQNGGKTSKIVFHTNSESKQRHWNEIQSLEMDQFGGRFDREMAFFVWSSPSVIRWIFGFVNEAIYWSFRNAKGAVVRLIINNNHRLIIMMEPLLEINTIAQCGSDKSGTSTRDEFTRVNNSK